MNLARICLHAIAAGRQDQYVSESTQQRLSAAMTSKTNRQLSQLIDGKNIKQTTNNQQSAVFHLAQGGENLASDRTKQILVMQFWENRKLLLLL